MYARLRQSYNRRRRSWRRKCCSSETGVFRISRTAKKSQNFEAKLLQKKKKKKKKERPKINNLKTTFENIDFLKDGMEREQLKPVTNGKMGWKQAGENKRIDDRRVTEGLNAIKVTEPLKAKRVCVEGNDSHTMQRFT